MSFVPRVYSLVRRAFSSRGNKYVTEAIGVERLSSVNCKYSVNKKRRRNLLFDLWYHVYIENYPKYILWLTTNPGSCDFCLYVQYVQGSAKVRSLLPSPRDPAFILTGCKWSSLSTSSTEAPVSRPFLMNSLFSHSAWGNTICSFS